MPQCVEVGDPSLIVGLYDASGFQIVPDEPAAVLMLRPRAGETDEERQELSGLVSKCKTAAYKIHHANMLLKVDVDGPGWSDKQAAEAFDCHRQIQALDRTQKSRPMFPGRLKTLTHDYKRHVTTTLFAAIELAEGRIIAECSI